MKMFVTGGTGFIGGHFIRSALRAGHEVVALKRPNSKPVATLESTPIWLDRPMDQIVASDLTNIDCFVHLASPGVSPQIAPVDELFYWNAVVLARIIESCAKAGVRRYVVAGTFAEYGRAGERYEFIPPNAPLEPTIAYAASKAAGFAAAHALAVQLNLELAYLRIFSAFGDGQHIANFWPSLREAALAGKDFEMTRGEQVRDYIRVEDVAERFVTATHEPMESGRPLVKNVGSGQPTTMRAFAETWWRQFRAPGKLLFGAIPYRSNEVMRFVPEL